MDKFKLLIGIIMLFIFIEGAGIIFFANRAQNINKIKPKIAQIQTEKDELANRYEELETKYRAIERDRNNLLIQAKQLLSQKNKVEESAAALEKLETLKKIQQAEKDQFEKERQDLLAELEQLKADKAKADEELSKYKTAFSRRKAGRGGKEPAVIDKDVEKRVEYLKKEHAGELEDLKKECERLKNEAEKAKKEADKYAGNLLKADKRIAGLRDSLEDYRKRFEEAKRKNYELDQESKDVPQKFSELARQNKQLLKETAQMHYNLGVFYTDNKEYKRAIAEFEKAAEINPEDAHSHFNLGYIYAEYLSDRPKAIAHFRHYLRYAEKDDKDVDWVKKYLLTWETFEGAGREKVMQ